MARRDNERRKHVRRPVFLQCRVEGRTVAGSMQLTDRSAGGGFIASDATLAVGSQVRLLINMAGTEGPSIGRVVRVQRGRGFAVVLNLVATSDTTRHVLERFLVSP